MINFSYSKLRILILMIVSLCITTKSIAMVTEMTMDQMPAMSSHCAEMMGDVQASSPDFPSHHDQEKTSCGNHYACLGLEFKSPELTMIAIQTELNTTQATLPYPNITTDGYFALPDPPPRYTLKF